MAIEVYQEAISRFPKYYKYYMGIAQVYLLRQQTNLATEAIGRAIELNTNPDVELFVAAGDIYRLVGDSEKARHFYQEALGIDPNNRSAISGLDYLKNK